MRQTQDPEPPFRGVPAMIPVHVRVVGRVDPPEVTWPDGWPLPDLDEAVVIPDDHESTLYVRNRTWYPQGTDDGEPGVYLVLGPLRRNH